MLDGLDVQRAVAQTRAPWALKDVFDQSGDTRFVIALLANEGDAGIRIGRTDGERGLLAGEEPRAHQPDFARDCLLAIGHGIKAAPKLAQYLIIATPFRGDTAALTPAGMIPRSRS